DSSLVSIGLWSSLGLVSASIAGWRLRPACLRPLDGERVLRRGKGRRRWHVPPVDERRPMLWKELFIERVGALGGLGWWLGALIVTGLLGGSLTLLAMMAFSSNPAGVEAVLKLSIGDTAGYFGWLIEWAVGLRAAVTISSERERETWDAILTSPLEGR